MGILDALRPINELEKRVLKEFKGVEGLVEVLEEIMNLGDSEIYWKFFQAFKMEGEINEPGFELTEAEKENIHLINIAYGNLSKPALRVPPFVDLIDFLAFYVMYRIFEDIYYVHKGSKMNHEDKIKILYGKLDERIVFALDKFDEVSNTPEPTAEFFLKLKKVKWKDKKTKKLYEKLHALNADNFIEKRRTVSNKFTATEDTFILFLAGCSAVNDDRDKIEQSDVIRAYKTYFKLLNTDITKLV